MHTTGVYPPQRLELDGFALRKATVLDDGLIARAVGANLERLVPWMPWANAGNATVEFQRERLRTVAGQWTAHESYQFLAVAPDGTLLGIFGLENRLGPGAIEIGYWLDAAATGRGVATEASRALTVVAFDLLGMDRVEIHMDEANERSRRVPERLGFQHERTEDAPVVAPGQTGRQEIWVRYREA